MSHFNVAVTIAVCALIFLTGCTSEADRWKDTESVNTISAYQQFLSEHSDGAHAWEARDRIEQLRMASLTVEVVSTELTSEPQPLPATEFLEFGVNIKGQSASLEALPPKVKMMVPPQGFSALIVKLMLQNKGTEIVTVSSDDVVIVDANDKVYRGRYGARNPDDGSPLWWYSHSSLALSFNISPSGNDSMALLFTVPDESIEHLQIRFGKTGDLRPLRMGNN